MRPAHRGPTLIALRARRQALHIARDIAYPHVELPHTEAPIPVDDPATEARQPMWHEIQPIFPFDDVSKGLAPWWIWWLVAGCLAAPVAMAAYVIFHSV